jgi:hypothetical protein
MDGAAIYFLKVKHILTIVLHEYAKKNISKYIRELGIKHPHRWITD